MNPILREGEFVFCTLSSAEYNNLSSSPIGWFREEEGITIIIERKDAEKERLNCIFLSRMITLNVSSSLDVVGFIAVISKRLAENGIAVNTISAYYHDHLFVPAEKAEEAMKLLGE
jgi:hypothetical protein